MIDLKNVRPASVSFTDRSPNHACRDDVLVGDAAPRVVGRDDTHGTGVAADDGGRADWHDVAMIDRH